MKLDRSKSKKVSLTEHVEDDFVPGTPEERLRMVWPLTREVASLSPNHDAVRSAMTVDVDGIRIRVLPLADLIRNELASGRTQDLADVEVLRGGMTP